MSSCPFCYGTLLPTFTHGLPREKCGRCAALWFEGEGLETVMGASATRALLAKAQGKHGECKDCDTPLTAQEPRCPECGRDAPSCPKCGIAPLSVTHIRGVEVDVCVRCHGMALDTGELEQLLERAGDEPAPPPAASPVRKKDTLRCASCQRTLRPEHAFASGSKLYCGSCAPEEASPYDAEMASHTSRDGDQPAASTDPVSRALGWLFSHING